ncbi:MAG: DNA polymerase III subunit delta [Candidatus Woesearchaeota archaeon]
MRELTKILKTNKGDIGNIYVISSEDEHILNGFRDKFISKFTDKGSFNYSEVNDDVDDFGKVLKNKANTLPVMANKRFIITKCREVFTKKTEHDEILIRLFEDFPATTVLLIVVYGKIDGRIKLGKTVKKAGEVVKVDPLTNRNLQDWIRNQFRQRNCTVDNATIALLEKSFNNDLERLKNEIEKITLYNIEKQQVTIDDVRLIISKDKVLEDKAIFDLTDALGARDKEKALSLFDEMVIQGEHPLGILAMLHRQVKLLLSSKSLKDQGKNYKAAAKMLKQHPYPIQKCYQQVNNFTEKKLESMLEGLLNADLAIKTGKYQEPKVAVEMFFFNF